MKNSILVMSIVWLTSGTSAVAQRRAPVTLDFPPQLPDGAICVTDTSDDFIRGDFKWLDGVRVAATPPTVDLLYFPGQDYEGKPWSNWGDSCFAGGKYYATIGDHLAPQGNAFVFEYDPRERQLRKLAETRAVLNLPDGHYMPGKIHTRLERGSDGWLYYATHRGSTRVTTDQYHYRGDWILRTDPASGRSEIVSHGPVPKHCIPNGVLDPDRLIYYGGTAPGSDKTEGIQFFAWDVQRNKLLYSGPTGPARCMILAGSTGRVYYTPDNSDSPLMRYDPAEEGAPRRIAGTIGIRAATRETPRGRVYTVSSGQRGQAILYEFDTRTETIETIGPAAVGTNQYIAAMDADPSGRYVYYVPGAHGGSDRDGSAIVQFDTRTRTRKVLATLHPYYQEKYGCTLKGTYSLAVGDGGASLYVTWNASRGSRSWDCCALTVIHIPESERIVERR